MKRWLGGGLLGLAMVMAMAGGLEAQEEDRGPDVGEVAPDFTLPAVQGTSAEEEITLSELRGQPVVLIFFRGGW